MRGLIAIIVFSYSTIALAQTEDEIDAILFPWLELALITSNDAQHIRDHLMTYGYPQVVEEAWSIDGLSEEVSFWLAQSNEWKILCTPKTNSQSKLFIAQTVGSLYGTITDFRFSSCNLGLRFIRNQNGFDPHGYLKINKGNTQLLIGDYVLPWGTGLLFRRDDFYHQMRSPHTLSVVDCPFRQSLSTVHRRGSVMSFSRQNWWTTTAIDLSSTLPEILTGSFFQFNNITSIGLISSSNKGYTSNVRTECNSFGLNAEAGMINSTPQAVLKAVYTPSKNLIIFGELNSAQNHLYGTRLTFSESFIQAQTTGLDLLIDIQHTHSTPNFTFATRVTSDFQPSLLPEFSARLKAATQTSSLTPITALGSTPSIGFKLSIPRLTLAIITGGSTRIYQSVPKARGTRIQSASTEQARFNLYFEAIPKILKVSFERVWAMEGELMSLSISLTHGKYIRH
ncbi:MAG: hypothetical protein CMB32_00780 [Euryarchaeota archaeon]|nr:hypothetical protein [Euryarchaeota archaeon]